MLACLRNTETIFSQNVAQKSIYWKSQWTFDSSNVQWHRRFQLTCQFTSSTKRIAVWITTEADLVWYCLFVFFRESNVTNTSNKIPLGFVFHFLLTCITADSRVFRACFQNCSQRRDETRKEPLRGARFEARFWVTLESAIIKLSNLSLSNIRQCGYRTKHRATNNNNRR